MSTLIVSVGEGFSYREHAQDLSWELGKLLRVNADGSIPADNPVPRLRPLESTAMDIETLRGSSSMRNHSAF